MSLRQLRNRIDAIDNQIAGLLAGRLEVARLIAAEKASSGQALLDPERERQVGEAWEERCRKKGIPPAQCLTIVQAILEAARVVELPAFNSSPFRVAIMGRGRMASTLQTAFARAGNPVFQLGKDGGKLSSADVVVLALQPAVAVHAAETLHGLEGKLVMDIASSKAKVFPEIEAASVRRSFFYVSSHPLFAGLEGPFTQRVVLLRSSTSASRWKDAIDLWQGSGFLVTISRPDQHDEAMSAVQVMVHFFLLAMMRALEDFALQRSLDLAPYETRTLKRAVAAAEGLRQNSAVVQEILTMNPYSRGSLSFALQEARRTAKQLLGFAEGKKE